MFVLAVLDEAQEFRLQQRGQVADFVEEKCSALARGDTARVVFHGPGKSAFDVAEEFAFQQFGRQRRATDHSERPGSPRAPLMDQTRDHTLAGAVFPANQHGGFTLGNLLGAVKYSLHRGAARFQMDFAGAAGGFQRCEFLFHLSQFVHAAEQQVHLLGAEGLGEIIHGPFFDGFDRGVDGGKGGDHHDLEPGAGLEEFGDKFESAVGSEAQIDEGHIERHLRRERQRVFGRRSTLDAVSPAIEPHRQHFTDARLIIDD